MNKGDARDGQPTLWNDLGAERASEVSGHSRPQPSHPRTPTVRTVMNGGRGPQGKPGVVLQPLWGIEQVAAYLVVDKQTIYTWRQKNYGPQGFRVGKHLRWHASTVIEWAREQEAQCGR